jgi:hypothetical protein
MKLPDPHPGSSTRTSPSTPSAGTACHMACTTVGRGVVRVQRRATGLCPAVLGDRSRRRSSARVWQSGRRRDRRFAGSIPTRPAGQDRLLVRGSPTWPSSRQVVQDGERVEVRSELRWRHPEARGRPESVGRNGGRVRRRVPFVYSGVLIVSLISRERPVAAVQVRIVAPVLVRLHPWIGLEQVMVREDQLLGYRQRLVAPEPVGLRGLVGPDRPEHLVAKVRHLRCDLLADRVEERLGIGNLRIGVRPVLPAVVERHLTVLVHCSPPGAMRRHRREGAHCRTATTVRRLAASAPIARHHATPAPPASRGMLPITAHALRPMRPGVATRTPRRSGRLRRTCAQCGRAPTSPACRRPRGAGTPRSRARARRCRPARCGTITIWCRRGSKTTSTSRPAHTLRAPTPNPPERAEPDRVPRRNGFTATFLFVPVTIAAAPRGAALR